MSITTFQARDSLHTFNAGYRQGNNLKHMTHHVSINTQLRLHAGTAPPYEYNTQFNIVQY